MKMLGADKLAKAISVAGQNLDLVKEASIYRFARVYRFCQQVVQLDLVMCCMVSRWKCTLSYVRHNGVVSPLG